MNRCASLLPFTLAAATLLAPPAAWAETHIVGPPGEADYPTIQEAVAVCSDGDTVLVLPGTYVGSGNRDVDIVDVSIVIRSRDGLGSVLLDCEQLGRGFLLTGQQDTTMLIAGLAIHNGMAPDGGGGVLAEPGASLKIADCEFRDCLAADYGGAISATNSTLVVRDSYFAGNSADLGGAIAFNASPPPIAGDACLVSGCEFHENRAQAGYNQDDEGGAIYLRFADCSVRDTVFEDNTGGNFGGGARVEEATGRIVLFERCRFTHNGALDGGGLALSCCEPVIHECRFERNLSWWNSGAAIGCFYAPAQIEGCTFVQNACGEETHYTLEFHGDTGVRPHITRCTLTNTGCWSYNCSLFAFGGTNPLVERCVLAFVDYGKIFAGTPGFDEVEITNCIVFAIGGGDSLYGNYHDNLFIDPLLCDVAADDLTACADSPCLPENNPWDVSIGAHGVGCGNCSSAVEEMSWGAIKALYR